MFDAIVIAIAVAALVLLAIGVYFTVLDMLKD